MNSLLENALHYADYGWKIIPLHNITPAGNCSCGRPDCQSPGKHPRIHGGLKAASSDRAMVNAWWAKWPDANIGCVCGPESFTVVDIDPRHGGDVSLAKLASANGGMPRTLSVKTGGGGTHYFFRYDPDCPCSSGVIAPGIDTRSGGRGYVVLPPSNHKSGREYEWAEGETQMAALPEWLKPKKQTGSTIGNPAAVYPIGAPKISGDIEARACAYLDRCPPAIQGAGGHSALLRAARVLVSGFAMTASDAARILWTRYNPRCVPPWDPTQPAQVKDFNRKISEAERLPSNHPRGWLLDSSEDDIGLLDFGDKIAIGLLETEDNIDCSEPDDEAQDALTEPAECPEELLHPPGLVGDICEWINSTAGCNQPLLAVGATLSACGALFGRKVRDKYNGRTNLYAIGVAHSSAGKDYAPDCIFRLFTEAGASDMIGGQVTSDSAIELALQQCPAKIFFWDEVGHMFSNIKNAACSTSGGFLRTVVPTLMQLYSSAHKLYVGKQRAEGIARRIDQPHACVYGMTSPDVLFSAISTAELRDGWLGRNLLFISKQRPKFIPNPGTGTEPPRRLVDSVAKWISFRPPDIMNGGSGDIEQAKRGGSMIISDSEAATTVFNSFRDEAYDRMINAGDDTQYLWGKSFQNARHVALIIAAGDGANEISEAHANYACGLVRFNTLQFAREVRMNVADSAAEAEKKRLYRIIDECGDKGITKKQLTRRTQWIRDRKTRDDYLDDLAESGMIKILKNNQKTKPIFVYFSK